MRQATDPSALVEMVGQELGVSSWQEMTQRRVDAFAEVTGDHQWIHVDPVRAAAGPYGSPLAHGLLALSLVPVMIFEVLEVSGVDLILNKAVGTVRFASPVRVGDRVRGRVTLGSARRRPRDFWEGVFSVAVETDGGRSETALRTEVTFLYRATSTPADW